MRLAFPSVSLANRPRRATPTPSPTPSPSATGTLTLSAVPSWDEKRIYQRATTSGGGQGKGTGSITLSISGASAGTINARVMSDDGVTVLQNLGQLVITNGQTSLPIAFIDARLGWFFVELQDSTNVWQRMTYKCGMGALYGLGGQSLMVRFMGRQDVSQNAVTYASQGLVANDNTAACLHFQDTANLLPTPSSAPWQKPGDYTNGTGPNGLGIGQFLNQMVALTGVNCGAFGRAQGAQDLFTFINGQSNWTILNGMISRVGGAFEGFFWGQGHSNSKAACTANSYSYGLDLIFAQLTAANSFSGYGKYVWTVPAYTDTAQNWGTPRQVAILRAGAKSWCVTNAGSGAVYVDMTDLELFDGVHPSQVGTLRMGNHFYRATRARYGASSGLGPMPISATRSGTDIDLDFTDVGQTTLNLVGTVANTIFAFSKGRTNKMSSLDDNRFPISTVTVISKTRLRLVLANDPGVNHELELWVNYPAGPNNLAQNDNIYDDRTDSDGITLGRLAGTNATAIAVAAPAGATINPPPGGYVTQTSRQNLSPTSATYGASASGFGQRLTGGYGLTGAGQFPGFYPVTVEGWITAPATTGAPQTLWGGFGDDFQLYLTSANKLAGGSGTKTFVAGQRYYIALSRGPGGTHYYIYDETANTHSDEYGGGAAFAMPPKILQFGVRSFKGSQTMTGANGSVDEVAVFESERYADVTAFAANRPTAPFTGNEANLRFLFHFDGDTTEAIAA